LHLIQNVIALGWGNYAITSDIDFFLFWRFPDLFFVRNGDLDGIFASCHFGLNYLKMILCFVPALQVIGHPIVNLYHIPTALCRSSFTAFKVAPLCWEAVG
jgi:hypothetical protein